MYENLQKFVLETFTLTFLELIILGIPVSITTIILALAGQNPPIIPIMLVVFIGLVWVSSAIAMWFLRSVWTIPIRTMKSKEEQEGA